MTAEREARACSLEAKIAFLTRQSSYPHPVGTVETRETHMSWVFLAGDRVYKLKKPLRLPYLDFSTLARRERFCRTELRLNRRLASDVYLDVVPLTREADGLALAGAGAPVDWLVVMRRLDERDTLEQALRDGRLRPAQVEQIVSVLVRFYRRARRRPVAPARHLAEWRRRLSVNLQILLSPGLGLPAGLVRRIHRAQRRFLARHGDILAGRVRRGRLVEGHGDLRPEHIWLADQVRIIDCLEFSDVLRTVDPFDEIAFLGLECERLGAPWAAGRLRRGLARGMRDRPPAALHGFYRCYRATLRARLAAAHLLEPRPRTPEKWPVLARTYLRLAAAEAARLEAALRRPAGR